MLILCETTLGLAWITIIDIVFLTIIIFSVLAFGARLSDALSAMVPQIPRLASIGYLMIVLVAIIIGYFTYDDIIVPPLYLQGVDWAYRLVFWLSVVGVSSGILFQSAQALYSIRRGTVSVIRISGTSLDGSASNVKKCAECGGVIDAGDSFCRWCGARIQEVQDDSEVQSDGAAVS